MGWTFKSVWADFSRKDAIAECDALINKARYHVLKSAIVDSVYYAALETRLRWNPETERLEPLPEGVTEITCAVVLTAFNRRGFNGGGPEWGYKDMDEADLPLYYGCPAGILNLLTPTENANAREWRKRCREEQDRKKAERRKASALASLPLGTEIRFPAPFDTHSGVKKGEPVTLVKAHGRKIGAFWHNGAYRWPVKLIPCEFTVTH